jgi:hypothetical protein
MRGRSDTKSSGYDTVSDVCAQSEIRCMGPMPTMTGWMASSAASLACSQRIEYRRCVVQNALSFLAIARSRLCHALASAGGPSGRTAVILNSAAYSNRRYALRWLSPTRRHRDDILAEDESGASLGAFQHSERLMGKVDNVSFGIIRPVGSWRRKFFKRVDIHGRCGRSSTVSVLGTS